MANGKLLKVSFLILGLCTVSEMASAGSVIRNEQTTPHKPVATVLPENGKLADDNGKLHQGIALECIDGKPGGISYYSPTNDLNIAINAAINIDVQVDHNQPVRFSATRSFNKKAPDALTAKSYDANNTLLLIHALEIAKNDVQVKVWRPGGDKSKTFRLKVSKMNKAVNHFRSFCDGK